MNKITEITRRDIIELFRYGFESDILGFGKIFYSYNGRLEEIEFLKKLYPLDKMPSNDPRFENAEGDIWQHTVNNKNDWESDWIFKDERFELFKGSDIVLLKFLCTVFHPENRDENGYWKKYLEKINFFIKRDGYELYENDKISGKAVYSWRKITPEESASGRFIPFSIRNEKELKNKTIILPSISKKTREKIFNLFERYDETQNRIDESNWHYYINNTEALIKEDIREYYIPQAFDSAKKYSKTDSLKSFIMNNYPYCVFDAIELFARYNSENNFSDELNLLFKNEGFVYRLLGGKIEIVQVNFQTKEVIKEIGLKELVEQAISYNSSSNYLDKQIAIEKLWDAFERLKTYCGNDKKVSVTRMISKMSNGNNDYDDLFNKEFSELTKIGNHYRIRHHEIDKIEIIDNNYYDYLFQRCYALIILAIKCLK